MLHFSNTKIAAIFAAILLGVFVALPNLFTAQTVDAVTGEVIPKSEVSQALKNNTKVKTVLKGWPEWLPQKQVHLGLDLQGG